MLRSVFFVLFIIEVDSARILGVFPAPSISHQVVFNAYVQELVKRGHEVVVITPNPVFTKHKPPRNLTEIDVSSVYEDKDANIMGPLQQLAKRGVVTDVDSMFESQAYPGLIYMIAAMFNKPEVKRLIEDKNQYFDLIVVEAFMNYQLIVSKIFNAPVIIFSSLYGIPENFDIVGAASIHPMLYPNLHRSRFTDLSLCQKITEVYQEIWIRYMFKRYEMLENDLLKQNFGPDTPNVDELKNNVAMLFLNAHPLFGNNRPVPPSVLYLGALHLKPIRELPQDLKEYLDNSKRGVVYVSLGSNVNPAKMHKDLLDDFLDAFEVLPYNILWKYDGDNLESMPKNLKIQKWFPQRDLLTHPNIKVFVTQGGLQSTDEAIDAGVPLVGIPMMGDQWFNANKYVELGIGKQLDALTLTAKDLVEAVKTVISDNSYRQNIKRLRAVMNYQPQRPLERAVWWTEHVLRHGGAEHLRAPAANMPWTEYLMLDVLVTAIIIVIAMLLLVITLIWFIVKSISRLSNKQKVKVG